jgi:PKD repeat protein
LSGAVLRVDPATGAALPGNPLFSNPDANAKRIIAHGLRNPYQFTFRPGTSEIWLGDVGWTRFEEINRITNPTDAVVENFGWPCLEGPLKQPGYDSANLNICENIYLDLGQVVNPYFAYQHSKQVVHDEICPKGSSSITGLEFQMSSGGPYPDEYDGALFFADYSRNCIWAMRKGGNGLPSPALVQTFVGEAGNPVDLELSASGELYYVDLGGGTVRKIVFAGENNPPTAVMAANPTSGDPPLLVNFDGTGSSDPDNGDTLSFAWDLDGDGEFDDSSSPTPSFTYTADGSYFPGLKVTDSQGLFDTDSVEIIVGSGGNLPPSALISEPSSSLLWSVGDTINFSGSATDPEDGTLPASALTWSILLHHCDITCHVHPIQDFVGVSSGSIIAPDHEYPSHLEIVLTATDSGGLQDTKSVLISPQTVLLTLTTQPPKFFVSIGPTLDRAPLSKTVIVGSTNTISAPSPQIRGTKTYIFNQWSDGGAQTHNITAPENPTTYTATFVQSLFLDP